MNAKQMQEAADAFKAEIISQLKAKADANGGKLAFSVDVLKAAAFPAFADVADSYETMTAKHAVIIWEGVMKINGSAFEQDLRRREKAKTLGFELIGGARTVKGLSLQYMPEDEPTAEKGDDAS